MSKTALVQVLVRLKLFLFSLSWGGGLYFHLIHFLWNSVPLKVTLNFANSSIESTVTYLHKHQHCLRQRLCNTCRVSNTADSALALSESPLIRHQLCLRNHWCWFSGVWDTDDSRFLFVIREFTSDLKNIGSIKGLFGKKTRVRKPRNAVSINKLLH